MIDILLNALDLGVTYVVAVALIAGGGYVALVLGANPLNPLSKTFRFVGLVLIAIGLLVGAVNYGKQIGGESVRVEWKAANDKADIARLKQEADAKSVAAETSAQQSKDLASDNDTQQERINDYKTSADKLAAALAVCRLPSVDDDRRMCELTGNTAPGCSNTK